MNDHDTDTHVVAINFWTRGRPRMHTTVELLRFKTSLVNPEAAESLFATFTADEPDVVIVGVGSDEADAERFINRYKRSPWFNRIPMLALLETSDEGMLIRCCALGCDDAMVKPINVPHLRSRVVYWAMQARTRRQERDATVQAVKRAQRTAEFANIIVPLGVAMMAETNFDALLDRIISEARRFCNADGGSLYLVVDNNALQFKIIVNKSMGIAYNERSKSQFPFDSNPLPLHANDGPRHIACHVAETGETVNVKDVYADEQFDFSGARAFDEKTGYRTKSLLTIALRDHAQRVIGVLQLINAIDPKTGETTVFDGLHEKHIESISLLAGQALESWQKMARLRKQADALCISVDKHEQQAQVDQIVNTDYFQKLKEKANALRNSPQPIEPAGKT